MNGTLDINGNFTLTAGTFATGSNGIDVRNWDDSGNNGGCCYFDSGTSYFWRFIKEQQTITTGIITFSI